MTEEEAARQAVANDLVSTIGAQLVATTGDPTSVAHAFIHNGAAAIVARDGPAAAAKLLRNFAAHIEKGTN